MHHRGCFFLYLTASVVFALVIGYLGLRLHQLYGYIRLSAYIPLALIGIAPLVIGCSTFLILRGRFVPSRGQSPIEKAEPQEDVWPPAPKRPT